MRDHLTKYEIAEYIGYVVGKIRRGELLYGEKIINESNTKHITIREYNINGFMEDMRSVAETYDDEYLSSFMDYWAEKVSNIYRFQMPDLKFIFNLEIKKWASLRYVVRDWREYNKALSEAEAIAKRKSPQNSYLQSRYIGGYLKSMGLFDRYKDRDINRPIEMTLFRQLFEFVTLMKKEEKVILQNFETLPDISLVDFLDQHSIPNRFSRKNRISLKDYVNDKIFKLLIEIDAFGIYHIVCFEQATKYLIEIEKKTGCMLHIGFKDKYGRTDKSQKVPYQIWTAHFSGNVYIYYSFQVPNEIMYKYTNGDLEIESDFLKTGRISYYSPLYSEMNIVGFLQLLPKKLETVYREDYRTKQKSYTLTIDRSPLIEKQC